MDGRWENGPPPPLPRRPHPQLQLARDPKLGKGESAPRQLNLASCAVGEAPETFDGDGGNDPRAVTCGGGGELLIAFDTHALPVVAERPALNDYLDAAELGFDMASDTRVLLLHMPARWGWGASRFAVGIIR